MADKNRPSGDRADNAKRGARSGEGEAPVRGARTRRSEPAATPHSRGPHGGKSVADAGRPSRSARRAAAVENPVNAKGNVKTAPKRTRSDAARATIKPAALDRAFIEMMSKPRTEPR